MATTYTLRYANQAHDMIRMLMIQCEDDQDALQTASRTMSSPYAALTISAGNKIVWRGSSEKVTAWVSSQPQSAPSYAAGAS